jgi:hypothetical protein
MKQTFSDAFRGALEGGDVVLEFGRARADSRGREVDLESRIAMPAATVKRLILSLHEAIQRQEQMARFRRPESPAPAGSLNAAPRGHAPVNARPDPVAEKGAQLLRLVADLGVPYQYERSFRISADTLAANRYLLTLNKRDVPGDPLARVLEICRRLDMPLPCLEAAREAFDMAHCVHFGFEGDAQSIVYKLYLERAVPELEARQARATLSPVLLHLAFKWDVVQQADVVSRYLWYPFYELKQIEARLAEVYRRIEASPSLAIAQDVLHLAAARTPAERLQYLEVHEDDNARWSFDLNVYGANLQVKDVQAVLQRMRSHFGVRPGDFQALYDQIKSRPLGHIAGGVHRRGDDFFNVYYGIAGFPQFSQRFG